MKVDKVIEFLKNEIEKSYIMDTQRELYKATIGSLIATELAEDLTSIVMTGEEDKVGSLKDLLDLLTKKEGKCKC